MVGKDQKRGLVTKPARKRSRAASAGQEHSRGAEVEDGSAEEAVAYIAEQITALRDIAGRHKLDVLHYLLGMIQLEADEHIRLRSKRKLS